MYIKALFGSKVLSKLMRILQFLRLPVILTMGWLVASF